MKIETRYEVGELVCFKENWGVEWGRVIAVKRTSGRTALKIRKIEAGENGLRLSKRFSEEVSRSLWCLMMRDVKAVALSASRLLCSVYTTREEAKEAEDEN